MNAFINYLIEANFGLIFFITIYRFCLRRENHFLLNRMFLLAGIFISLLFPLLRFNSSSSEKIIPSISRLVPSYWLPEVTIGGDAHESLPGTTVPVWSMLKWIYGSVALIFAMLFVMRLLRIIRLILWSDKYPWNQCFISESDGDQPTFSFFNFIFIGQVSELSASEREEVLRHEWVHVRKFHSADIILVHLLGVVFWFNPWIRTYQKALAELHEFEADAHSIKSQDVDEYCRLLTRIALRSSGLSLVNYFNNSLTLKRITMMKTIQKKIENWRIAALIMSIPVFFFAVSCQDQVIGDLKDVGKNSATAGVVPTEVKAQLDLLQSQNPTTKYIVIQMNEEGKKTLDKLKFENAQTGSQLPTMSVINTSKNSDGAGFTYVILEDGRQAGIIANVSASDDSVHSFAEQMPEYTGGMEAMIAYMQKEMKYPEQSMKAGTQGKVFVEFVIDRQGAVVNPKILKGVNEELDKEALRVVSGFPQWIPGKNKGLVVSVKYVLPISFRI